MNLSRLRKNILVAIISEEELIDLRVRGPEENFDFEDINLCYQNLKQMRCVQIAISVKDIKNHSYIYEGFLGNYFENFRASNPPEDETMRK